MNNGQWQIGETEAGWRLDRWLASMRRLGSQTLALAALANGRIVVNKVVQTEADAERLLQPGDVVRVWIDRQDMHLLPETPRQFDYLDIVYEDRYLLVLNKPAGLLSTPHPYWLAEESLFDLAEEYLNFKRRQPFIIHRIDRNTTGLVLFAKTLAAQEGLREQFTRREPERLYWAVTRGAPEPEAGTWQDQLVWKRRKRRFVLADDEEPFVREAICHYRVLERYAQAALLEVRLVTGKRNQIRLQAQLHGHPLVGEQVYTDAAPVLPDAPFARQALHAYRLGFRHPIKGNMLKLEAPLPDDFVELLTRLRQSP
jgi:23S rRNA pseudouridine1911/1915/1917 synthase